MIIWTENGWRTVGAGVVVPQQDRYDVPQGQPVPY